MELIVVGCSGSVPGPESPASCYLVQAPYEGRTFSLLLDLGSGSFGVLQRHLDPSTVGAIGLSHLHPDHCLDLCAFHVASAWSPTAPWPRIPVLGPPGSLERMARAYDADGRGEAAAGLAVSFDFTDWRPSQRVGPFALETTRVDHPVVAYAIRVTELDGGATLVYSGDTGPCAPLTDLANGADLLLIEAGFDEPEQTTGVHLTGRQAAEIATAAGARRVLLTHIPPWHDPRVVLAAARPHFEGPLEIATSGARRPVGPA